MSVPPQPQIETRPKWKHREGDEYRVAIGHAWMNEQGFGVDYDVAPARATHRAAVSEGFRLAESDDFNVWVIRKGELVASLWMDEVVDDGPEALDEMRRYLG